MLHKSIYIFWLQIFDLDIDIMQTTITTRINLGVKRKLNNESARE